MFEIWPYETMIKKISSENLHVCEQNDFMKNMVSEMCPGEPLILKFGK